ncbi:MAG: hypothetical protein R6U21_04800 [Thermoplasmatota archaeon]
MLREEYHNCWEFHQCPEEKRKDCYVYNAHLGRTCWQFVGYAHLAEFALDTYESCENCPWKEYCIDQKIRTVESSNLQTTKD